MTSSAATSGSLAVLRANDRSGTGIDLALKHMPVLMLDNAEPYQPVAMGYTVFDSQGQSPSSKFQIVPQGGPVIEYAIWYDWDIQHMYDLEHVWVYLDSSGEVTRVDASRHGKRVRMVTSNGSCQLNGDRPVVYSEAGKHAHWAGEAEMRQGAGVYLPAMCSDLAAWWGVHLGNPFCESGRFTPTAFDHRLAKLKMKADAFLPSFGFSTANDDGIALVPWPILDTWIPTRVKHLISRLPEEVPHIQAVLFDCGDTIADEATEVKHPGSEVVIEADFIPGAPNMVRHVHRAGYRMALVADGPRETFENILKPAELWPCFEDHIISGDIGELKPSSKMFSAAFDALGLDRAVAGRTVMIGNNLARDIKGANDFGIISVFLNWSKRRTHEAADPSEVPDHTIETPTDFLPLLTELEEAMAATAKNREVSTAPHRVSA
jgi:FMN phosphatase YigB (HAD superfamily)